MTIVTTALLYIKLIPTATVAATVIVYMSYIYINMPCHPPHISLHLFHNCQVSSKYQINNLTACMYMYVHIYTLYTHTYT